MLTSANRPGWAGCRAGLWLQNAAVKIGPAPLAPHSAQRKGHHGLALALRAPPDTSLQVAMRPEQRGAALDWPCETVRVFTPRRTFLGHIAPARRFPRQPASTLLTTTSPYEPGHDVWVGAREFAPGYPVTLMRSTPLKRFDSDERHERRERQENANSRPYFCAPANPGGPERTASRRRSCVAGRKESAVSGTPVSNGVASDQKALANLVAST